MSFNVQEYVKERILKMLGIVDKEFRKVLVVDKTSIKVIEACFPNYKKYFEEELISVIVDISEERKSTRRKKDVIYFVTPTIVNVDLAKEDFEDKKFRAAFIFFTSKIPDVVEDEIKEDEEFFDYVEVYAELNCEFQALEKCVFSLDYDNSYHAAFVDANDILNSDLENISMKLFTFLSTVREKPIIRYDSRSKKCEAISQALSETLKETNKPYPEGRSVLLIVDRLVDLVTPLLHCFTYQPMLMETHSPDGTDTRDIRMPSTMRNPPGNRFTEDDWLWIRYRHLHLAQLGLQIQKDTKRWGEETKNVRQVDEINPQILNRVSQYFSEHQLVEMHVKLTKRMEERVKRKKLRDLAVLEQDLATGLCLDTTTTNNNNNEGAFLIDLKDPVKHVLSYRAANSGAPILQESNADEKVRVIMALIASYYRKYQHKKYKLERTIRLSGLKDEDDRDYQRILENFQKYLVEPYSRKKHEIPGILKVNNNGNGNGGMRKLICCMLRSTFASKEMILSRYRNKLDKILEELLRGRLKEERFAFVENTSEEAKKFKFTLVEKIPQLREVRFSRLGGRGHPEEGRAEGRAEEDNNIPEPRKCRKWVADADSGSSEEESEGESDDSGDESKEEEEEEGGDVAPALPTLSFEEDQRNRLLVFLVGGVTYSEIRDFYLMLEKFGVAGAIGGTSILTPNSFLEKVQDMDTTLEGDGLIQDI